MTLFYNRLVFTRSATKLKLGSAALFRYLGNLMETWVSEYWGSEVKLENNEHFEEKKMSMIKIDQKDFFFLKSHHFKDPSELYLCLH